MTMEWCFPAMKECGGPGCIAVVGIDCESILAIVEGGCDLAWLARKEGGMCREKKVGCREDHNAAETGKNMSWEQGTGLQM